MSRATSYIFKDEVNTQLAGFRSQLKEKGYADATIRQKCNYVGYFLQWLDQEHLQWEQARYNDLLNYIDYCRLNGESKKLVNNKLRSIRNFYWYKKEMDPTVHNPALHLMIRGEYHRLPSGNLDYKTLEKLYDKYSKRTLRDKRNKVILGLLIYQGITTGELQRMEPGHVQLNKGRIFIQGTRKTGSRYLQLQPQQILEIDPYLKRVRPEILKRTGKKKPSRKPNHVNQELISERMFCSINGSEDLRSTLLHMFRNIHRDHPEIRNAKQIRSSVITHWLKHYNLRQVQYMAGHKYVSSTERYQMNNLDKLQGQLEKYHPLADEA
jgi:integrase/recombinase XerD